MSDRSMRKKPSKPGNSVTVVSRTRSSKDAPKKTPAVVDLTGSREEKQRRDLSLLDWLEYHNDQGNALAEIHKDSLRAVFKRQVTPFQKKFSTEDPAHERRTKAVVQQFHQVFLKTIENLTQLNEAMLREFQERFPETDNEDLPHETCSVVSSSSVNGEIEGIGTRKDKVRGISSSGNSVAEENSVTEQENGNDTSTGKDEVNVTETVTENPNDTAINNSGSTASDSEQEKSDQENIAEENPAEQVSNTEEGYGSDQTVFINSNQIKNQRASRSSKNKIKDEIREQKTKGKKAAEVAIKKERLSSTNRNEKGKHQESDSRECSEGADSEDEPNPNDHDSNTDITATDQTEEMETELDNSHSQSLLNVSQASMDMFENGDAEANKFQEADATPLDEDLTAVIEPIPEAREHLDQLADNNYFSNDIDMLGLDDILSLPLGLTDDCATHSEDINDEQYTNVPSPAQTLFVPNSKSKSPAKKRTEDAKRNSTSNKAEQTKKDLKLESSIGDEVPEVTDTSLIDVSTKEACEQINAHNIKSLSKDTDSVKNEDEPFIDNENLLTSIMDKSLSEQVIDNQKPSTSKKAAAELNRSHRRTKRTSGDKTRHKLSKAQEEARRGVLHSSSDEDDEVDKSTKVKSRNQTKRKGSQQDPVENSVYDLENDLKLKPDDATVKLNRLALEIEKELKNSGFIKLDQRKKNGSSSDDSDSSMHKLDKAIKQLTTYNPIINGKSKSSKLRKGKEKKTKSGKDSRKKQGSNLEDQLNSSENDENTSRSTIENDEITAITEASKDHGTNDSSGSDMEVINDDDSSARNRGLSTEKTQENKKSKGKKYVTPNVDISSSDDSEKENRKKVLAKDSDDDSDTDVTKSRKSKKADDNSSDDDGILSKRVQRKRGAKNSSKRLLSESEGDKSKSSKEDNSDSEVLSIHDSESDSDFKSKKSKSKRKKKDDSSTDEDRKRKKKRKRIKEERDSDQSETKSNDSDIQEVDAVPASQKRKQIRGIMGNKDLQKSTRQAEKDEEERKKRVSEKQKLFNGLFETEGGDASTDLGSDGAVKRLVLDIDPETKEAVIEVEKTIVNKLKPHQADGIKFMYTTCFESLEMIKKKSAGGGCILAHCMGLGKTLQTVAFTFTILSNQQVTGIRTALVVCPLNTVNNWYKEYQQWLADTERPMALHDLWSAKTIRERIEVLKLWQKRGGVGIIHYDLFRSLVNTAVGKGKGKVKGKPAQREAIIKNLLDPGPDMIICDEGHLLKNCKSKLTEALSKIKTIRRIVLTGTPLQNNLVEYHTMVNFVKPNLLGSLKEFTNRFVNPIKNGQCKDSSERDVKIMKRRAHVLHSKLDGCVQRLDYSVLTPYLPPKYEYCIIIKLSEKQKQLYRQYLSSQVGEDQTERARRILQHYAVLIKILAHPIVLTMKKATAASDVDSDEEGSLKDFIDDGGDLTEGETSPSSGSDVECLDPDKKKIPTRRTRSCKTEVVDPEEANSNGSANKDRECLGSDWWCNLFQSKEEMQDVQLSGKLVVLQEILKICETIGDRVLVFSQYLTTLNIIEEFLDEWDSEAKAKNGEAPRMFPPLPECSVGRWRQGIEYFRIDGSTKSTDRQKHCDVFNKKSSSKAKLFLISTKAGGLGINLFGANRVVIFDASWNPSNDMQSIFRVFRFGQQKPCYIYRFVAQATMEEKIYNRQVVKLSLSSRVVDEHQVERHFKFDDINEMYKYNPDEKSDRPTPPLPKDRLLANLLISHKNWVDSYFEHDTLLVNKQDEELSEEERKQAWEEYRTENDRQANPGYSVNDMQTLMKIKSRLIERFPLAPENQIHLTAVTVLQKINDLRIMLHRFNLAQASLSPQERVITERNIKQLQDWIALALNGTTAVEGVPGANSVGNPGAQFQTRPAATTFSRSVPPPPPMIRMPTIAPVHMQNSMLQSVGRIMQLPSNFVRNVAPPSVMPPSMDYTPSYARPLPYAPNGPANMNAAPGGPDDPLTLD